MFMLTFGLHISGQNGCFKRVGNVFSTREEQLDMHQELVERGGKNPVVK